MAGEGGPSHRELDCVVSSGVSNCGRGRNAEIERSAISAAQALLLARDGDGRRDPHGAAAARRQLSSRRIVRRYLWGQLANVVRAAFWWSGFGVLSASLLQRPLAIGVSRAAFNAGLLLLSPSAAALCKRVSIRSLLVDTTVLRLVLWSLCFPGAFVALQILLLRSDLLLGAALVLMFIDGAAVALGNLADVDCGGLDLLSLQYGLVVSQGERARCCVLHQTVFDSSFIFLTPPLAWSIYLLAQRLFPSGALSFFVRQWFHLPKVSVPTDQSEPLLLLISMAAIFALLSVFSLTCYCLGLPPRRSLPSEEGGRLAVWRVSTARRAFLGDRRASEPCRESETAGLETRTEEALQEGAFSVASEDSFTDLSVEEEERVEDRRGGRIREGGVENGGEGASLGSATKMRILEVYAGMKLACANQALGFRLLFLAAETALEDCLVSLLLPLLCLHAGPVFGGRDGPTAANAWCCAVIACGKMGGCFSSFLMLKFWKVPPVARGSLGEFRFFFFFVAAAGASLLLLPGAVYLQQKAAPLWLTSSMVLAAAFLYFFFNTIPKVGFASLLQGLVTSQGEACRVFGFVGVFVTLVDAMAILSMNVLFATLLPKGVLTAVSALVGVYVLHGIVEAAFGPCLVLRRAALQLAETEEETERFAVQRQNEASLLEHFHGLGAASGGEAGMRGALGQAGDSERNSLMKTGVDSRTSTACASN